MDAEYVHNASLSFSLFDNYSFTNFFINLRGSCIEDKITNASSLDANFRQIITPVNISQEVNSQLYSNFGTAIRPLDIKFHLSASGQISRSLLQINGAFENVNRSKQSLDLNIENRKKKIVDMRFGYKIDFNKTQYESSSAFNQSFIRSVIYANASLDILKKWVLSSSFDYQSYHGEAFSSQLQLPIWRASISISRMLLKNDRGQLSLSVFDLLNKNQGINRNSNFNFIEDSCENTIKHYFMLSFTCSLSNFKSKSGIEIQQMHER